MKKIKHINEYFCSVTVPNSRPRPRSHWHQKDNNLNFFLSMMFVCQWKYLFLQLMSKNLYIIGGCNGAGKTTASYTVLPSVVTEVVLGNTYNKIKEYVR